MRTGVHVSCACSLAGLRQAWQSQLPQPAVQYFADQTNETGAYLQVAVAEGDAVKGHAVGRLLHAAKLQERKVLLLQWARQLEVSADGCGLSGLLLQSEHAAPAAA